MRAKCNAYPIPIVTEISLVKRSQITLGFRRKSDLLFFVALGKPNTTDAIKYCQGAQPKLPCMT